jgi:hypothetical protein
LLVLRSELTGDVLRRAPARPNLSSAASESVKIRLVLFPSFVTGLERAERKTRY